MTGGIIAAEIKKYGCAIERAKKLRLVKYIPHFENILNELKEIQELDGGSG